MSDRWRSPVRSLTVSLQFCPVAREEVDQHGQQEGDAERDSAEQEEGLPNGRVPSPRGQGGEFPGTVGEIDLAGDGISFENGLFPGEDMVGAILEEQIQAGGGRVECGLGEERGDVAINRDETPEGGFTAVNGLPSHQLQHLLAKRVGSAQDDPPRADGALDVGTDLERAGRGSDPAR